MENEVIQCKPKIVADIFDVIAVIINFVLTFALIKNLEFSFRFTVIYLLIFAFATVYIVSKKKIFHKEAILPGACAVIASFAFSLHETYFNTVVLLLLIYLSGSYCVKLCGTNKSKTGSWFYLLDVAYCEIFMPLKRIFLPFGALGRFFKGLKKDGKSRKLTALWIVLGIIIAVPVLFIIIPLLMDGDVAFNNIFENLADKIDSILENMSDDLGVWILEFVVTLFVAPYIYSVMFCFRHGITAEENTDRSLKYNRIRKAPDGLIIAFLSVISLVYLVYLFSQLTYVFSAFGGQLPKDYAGTVSDYAREGFFSLIAIAVVNFVIIAAITLFSKRNGDKLPLVQKIFSLYLSIVTMLICASSMAKIIIYISSYGMTAKRLLGFVGDIVLLIVFICIIVRLFTAKFPYMKVILCTVCIAVTALGLAGVNNIVLSYNCKAAEEGRIEYADVVEYNDDIIPLKTLENISSENLIKIIFSDEINISYVVSDSLGIDVYEYLDQYQEYDEDGCGHWTKDKSKDEIVNEVTEKCYEKLNDYKFASLDGWQNVQFIHEHWDVFEATVKAQIENILTYYYE